MCPGYEVGRGDRAVCRRLRDEWSIRPRPVIYDSGQCTAAMPDRLI